jgi:hypothetical protein
MLYAGLDLSGHRLDVHVMNQAGQPLLVTAAPPDADGLGTALKNRVHATLLAFGKPWVASDLFGAGGRRLLDRLEVPAPWAGTLAAAVQLIDDLDERVAGCERELRRLGADHP